MRPEASNRWHYSRNGTLGPWNITPSSRRKVWWLCPSGHESYQSPAHFLRTMSCPVCSGHQVARGVNDFATHHPAQSAEWNLPKNGGRAPWEFSRASGFSAWWTCLEGHDYRQTIHDRANGAGCPFCSGRRSVKGRTDLASQRPDVAVEWHETLNGDNRPNDYSSGSGFLAWWQCARGHEWNAPIHRRSAGHGCPFCAGLRPTPGLDDLSTTHPQICVEWDFHANGALTPESVSQGSSRRVHWICMRGHRWVAQVSSRVKYGHRCPYCAGQRAVSGVNDLATASPELAGQWDSVRNGGRKPEDILPKSQIGVWWSCDVGHSFRATPANRAAGHGCPYCSGRRPIPGETDLRTKRPDLAAEWHPTLNSKRPVDFTEHSSHRAWWLCTKGHEWQTTIQARTDQGTGCRRCSPWGTSKPEASFFASLSTLFDDIDNNARLPVRWRGRQSCSADIVGSFRGARVVVEYDGSYFHRSKSNADRDRSKTETLLQADYFVVRIRETTRQGQLPFLELFHPRLLQLHHFYTAGTSAHRERAALPTVRRIMRWLDSVVVDDRAAA